MIIWSIYEYWTLMSQTSTTLLLCPPPQGVLVFTDTPALSSTRPDRLMSCPLWVQMPQWWGLHSAAGRCWQVLSWCSCISLFASLLLGAIIISILLYAMITVQCLVHVTNSQRLCSTCLWMLLHLPIFPAYCNAVLYVIWQTKQSVPNMLHML